MPRGHGFYGNKQVGVEFMSEEKKGRRVTIDLTPGATAEVDRLTKLTGLTTADVFRYALTVFRIYVDEKVKGRNMNFSDPNNREITTQVELPISIVPSVSQ
jgi:hypothetical protein